MPKFGHQYTKKGTRLRPSSFESPAILKKLASASRQLAELKGLAASMPNQAILINALSLQEAKDSSAIENIVTTHDELFRKLPGTTLKDGSGRVVYTPPQANAEIVP